MKFNKYFLIYYPRRTVEVEICVSNSNPNRQFEETPSASSTGDHGEHQTYNVL